MAWIEVKTAEEAYRAIAEGKPIEIAKGSFDLTIKDRTDIEIHIGQLAFVDLKLENAAAQIDVYGGMMVRSQNGNRVKVSAYDDARIVAFDDIEVIAKGNANVAAFNSVEISAYDNVKVTARSNANIGAYNAVKVIAHDESRVVAHDSAEVIAYDSAHISAYDEAIIDAYDDVKIQVFQCAKVTAHGNVVIEIPEPPIIKSRSDKVKITTFCPRGIY